MRIETYRGAPFVDREEEIDFFVEWFSEVPQRILWVYGPKSSGKTTVIEYVIEKQLLTEKEWWARSKYWVKYINLREKFLATYRNFIESLVVPEDVYEEEVKTRYEFSTKVFKVKREKIEKVRRRELDWGEVLMEEVRKAAKGGKIGVLVIDEIQRLRDVYIENGNGERELLKEFLNFCVRLTKETHLCHVVILTSNTVFIERIYNDAKLKKTSEFKKVDHLRRYQVEEWLMREGFESREIETVWDYYGGCIADILKVIGVKKRGKDLRGFLEGERWLAYTEIVDCLGRGGFDEEQKEIFKNICREIVERGYFELRVDVAERYFSVIDAWVEKEILFYDPLMLRVTGNSRIYEKGMELLFEK